MGVSARLDGCRTIPKIIPPPRRGNAFCFPG
jgi:hypothetical protein